MNDEPDWSQIDATEEQIKAWMHARVTDVTLESRSAKLTFAGKLAWEAHEHFRRPFHLAVLRRFACQVLGIDL
jgi:hypothetical protein